jgi:hypothetical protein
VPILDTSARTWLGYAAATVWFAFAAVSFYWAAGGTTGLDTLGGTIEALALARVPTLIAVTWVTGVLKVGAGVLALALVQPWGRRLRQRPLRLAGWCGAALTVVYGVVQFTSVGLVATGVVATSEPESSKALFWRLVLWEPWFVVCGVLLGLATRSAQHRSRRP